MELYFQCGYGFMELAKDLSSAVHNKTYILSPRDLAQNTQIRFAKNLRALGNSILFDSQLYAPQSDKKNFSTYQYWPDACKTGDSDKLLSIVDSLGELNKILGCKAFVLPAFKLNRIPGNTEDGKFRLLKGVSKAARKFGLPRYMTLCLEQIVLLDKDSVDRLIEFSAEWDVEGFYLVAEHPDSDYFVDNPFWMAQLMRLCAGFKFQGKKVILGYANHQMLCMSCVGIDAIASGNWMNTRSFTFDKFKEDTGDIKRHKLWYYAPDLMTEYSVPYLDVAYSGKVLKFLDCRHIVPNSPASIIFDQMAQPSTIPFHQRESFVHYLLALNEQCDSVESAGIYKNKYAHYLDMLKNAEIRRAHLEKYRINGQNRDFGEIIKVNETALAMFDGELGMRMQMIG